jgi:hypothetical protein
MLLQTNSYVVPKEKRAEHARLLNRFRQTMIRLGCESFEVFEQAGANWGSGEPSGRYVQLIRFRDKKQHQAVQQLERSDVAAQKLIAEFCELINFPYQQQQGLFAVGFYNSLLPMPPARRSEVSASVVSAAAPAGDSSLSPAEAVGEGKAALEQPSDEPPIHESSAQAEGDSPVDDDDAAADDFDLDLTELDLPDPSLDHDLGGNDEAVDLDAADQDGSHVDGDAGGAKR